MLRFLSLALLFVALPAQAQKTVVDEHPQLIGGIEGLIQEITYPETAKAEGTEGTVFVKFVVDEQGAVTDAEIAQSVSPELDAEALRATRQARFTPGKDAGQPVKVQYTLPIKFVLAGEQTEDR